MIYPHDLIIINSDRDVTESVKNRFERQNKKFCFGCRIDVSNQVYTSQPLPRGYLYYLLHPRETAVKSILDLKMEQEDSLVACIGRNKQTIKPDERNVYDNIFWVPTIDDILGILSWTFKMRKIQERENIGETQ